TNWFLVFGTSEGSTGYSLHGRFVDTNGVPGGTVDIDTDVDNSTTGSVAFSNGTYMVSWTKMVQQSPLFARTFSPAGAPMSPRTVLWSDPVDQVMEDQTICGGSGRFLVTWIQTGGLSALHGLVLD